MGGKQSKQTKQEESTPDVDYTEYDAQQKQAKFVLLHDPRADVNLLPIVFTFLGRCDFLRMCQCCHAMRRIGSQRQSRGISSMNQTISEVFQSVVNEQKMSDDHYSIIFPTLPSTHFRFDMSDKYCDYSLIDRHARKHPLLKHITSMHLLAYQEIGARNLEEGMRRMGKFVHVDTLHLHAPHLSETTLIDLKCLSSVASQLRVLTLSNGQTVLHLKDVIPQLVNLRVLTLPTIAGLDGVLLHLHQLEALCVRHFRHEHRTTVMSDIRQLSIEHELRSLSLAVCTLSMLCPLFQTRAQAATDPEYHQNDGKLEVLCEIDKPMDPEFFCPDQLPNLTNIHCYGQQQFLMHRFPNWFISHLM